MWLTSFLGPQYSAAVCDRRSLLIDPLYSASLVSWPFPLDSRTRSHHFSPVSSGAARKKMNQLHPIECWTIVNVAVRHTLIFGSFPWSLSFSSGFSTFFTLSDSFRFLLSSSLHFRRSSSRRRLRSNSLRRLSSFFSSLILLITLTQDTMSVHGCKWKHTIKNKQYLFIYLFVLQEIQQRSWFFSFKGLKVLNITVYNKFYI